MRARRSVLVSPGSNPALVEETKRLGSAAVCLDLADAVAPAQKAAARGRVVDALGSGGWGERLMTVRVNDVSTQHTYRDVIEVVEGAGRHLDAIVLPQVHDASHVVWLDLLLSQIEATMGLEPGRIGIEAQIDTARGLQHAAGIAMASSRVHSLVFGPGSFAVDLGIATSLVGAEPFLGALDSALLTVRAAATAAQVHAVLGLSTADRAGFRARTTRAAALGFDGTWVLDAAQREVADEVFAASDSAAGQEPGLTQEGAPTR